ncbi:alpha/beta hydrolase-fold protein [Myroides sp. LJL115]
MDLAQEEFYKTKQLPIDSTKSARELYEQLKNYAPYLDKEKINYSLSFAINDTLNSSFLVHLPANYNPSRRYPVLVVLHGAVRFTRLSDFQVPSFVLGDYHRYYTEIADLKDVILVFPSADKNYNWMTSDAGFFMVPSIVRMIKKTLSIDDNKVFLTGHSNGATGSFSYWMKDPSDFAGFFGFNTYPKVFTGGTFVENAKNSSFINFSTDLDYYYPPCQMIP